MEVLFIIISLAIVIGAYFLVAMKDQSFINILTPTYFTFIPGYFLLVLLHIYYFGLSGSTFAYGFSYLTYAVCFMVLALAYTQCPRVKLNLPFHADHDIKWLPYIFLAGSLLVFLPVLIEFSQYITSPREIYIRTRSGYGHLYFVSTMLTYVGFVLCLFKKKTFKGEKILFFVLGAMLCLLHGSKGQVVQLFFIAMMYQVFVRGIKASFKKVVSLGLIFSTVLISLFYLFSTHNELDTSLFLRGLAGYSDYTSNTSMLIDDEPDLTYGRLTMETIIYSRIPRVIYPDKPKDWGTFYLAKKYFPVWFEKETGAASFGMLGVPFSDFGYFSIIYLALWAAITGIFLRLFVDRLRRYNSPSDFIMLLFFANVVVIPTGVGYSLPEHFVLALLVSFLLKIRLVREVSPQAVHGRTLQYGIEGQS